MYHVQYAKISFREIRFPDVWRRVESFSHKIILALQESRAREAERLLTQYKFDKGSIFTKFD